MGKRVFHLFFLLFLFQAAIVFTVQYSCVVCLFLLNLFSDRKPLDYDPVYEALQNPSPEISAPFVSILFFEWLTPLLWWGYRRPLRHDDLWDIDPKLLSHGIVPNFERELEVPDFFGPLNIALFLPLHFPLLWL